MNCAACAASVTPSTSFITERGTLCGACFARHQNAESAKASSADSLDRSLARRAKTNGYAHGLVWGVTAILCGSWTRRMGFGWVTPVVIVGALVLAFGLALRTRAAHVVALVIDTSAALALLAWIAINLPESWIFLPVVLFPAALFTLAWTIRHAYAPPTRTL
jgi:hypothetical protein